MLALLVSEIRRARQARVWLRIIRDFLAEFSRFHSADHSARK
jgi:hypothetical protein